MAYMGAINYFDLPFGGIEWNQIGSPFEKSDSFAPVAGDSNKNDNPPALVVQAWNFVLLIDLNYKVSVIFDQPKNAEREVMKCVIIGSSKGDLKSTGKPRAHYLLIVQEREDGRAWERIGVGFAEGDDMTFAGPAVEIQIW
jgi:hypothetical protein